MKTSLTHKKALQSAIALWYIPSMKKGTLKTNGVHLRDHEYATVKLLLENGYDVELVPPSQINGLRMPDIMLPFRKRTVKPSGCARDHRRYTH